MAWGACLLGLFASAELACRSLGLHTPVLYEQTTYGYRPQPGQDIRRFGNRIRYNSFGMRSEPATAMPAAGVVRILCLGDSITNGGASTDQAETIPYLLGVLLRTKLPRAEVLNASAAGWATSNEAGWLRENGTFGSRALVLAISTHDLFQPFAGQEILDRHPSFPSHAPRLGLQDFMAHYVLPAITRRMDLDPGVAPSMEGAIPVEAAIGNILQVAELARRSGAVPFLLFVEQPAELERADPQAARAKLTLFEALQAHRVAFVNAGAAMGKAGGANLFRDGLHPNRAGNRVLAEVVAELISSTLP